MLSNFFVMDQNVVVMSPHLDLKIFPKNKMFSIFLTITGISSAMPESFVLHLCKMQNALKKSALRCDHKASSYLLTSHTAVWKKNTENLNLLCHF